MALYMVTRMVWRFPKTSLFGGINGTVLRKPLQVSLYSTSKSGNENNERGDKDQQGNEKDQDRDDKFDKRLKKTKEASQKLHQLLQSIIKDSEKPKTTISEAEQKLDLAKPKSKLKKKDDRQQKVIKKSEKDGIAPELISAAKDVSQAVTDEPQKIESDLLQRLRVHVMETEKAKKEAGKSDVNLNEFFVGMKIDRTKASPVPQEDSRARRVRLIFESQTASTKTRKKYDRRLVSAEMQIDTRPKGFSQSRAIAVDLFGSKPLGIFTSISENDATVHEVPVLNTWKKLQERELQLAVTHPPSNGFEEMILLTDQGKLWHFPIDNEQGLEEEAKVGFHEHIFLEKHLEPWCPPSGPIRHFMELVCVGLSKNPYFTVEKKKEHIEWFHRYFEEKRSLLQDLLN